MLRLELRDGTIIGLTDHDRNLDFNLGSFESSVPAGTLTYDAGTGILTSNVALACGLDADNYEISGPIKEAPYTEIAFTGGRWNRARAHLFEVNWRSLADGPAKFMAGNVCEIRVEGGRFILEIRSDLDRLNQTEARTLTNQCSGDHAACCVNIAPETATTVTAVTSELEFTVAATLTDSHVPGRLWFTSGELAGTEPVEIFARSGNTVTMFAPLVVAPQVGDALVVKEGCDRTRTMCRERFDNVIEFRGYPEVPGRKALMPAVPKG